MKLKLNRYWGLLAALFVTGSHGAANAVTFNTPVLATNVGWDCLLSGKGSEQGIVFLTFEGDGFSGTSTFTGAMVLAKVAAAKPAATDRSGSPSTRDPGTPAAPAAITNIYGFTTIDGQWNYDAQGYTVGVFTYNVVGATSTNVNQVSFRAKISPNKRLTASFSSSMGGNGTMRGVPIKTVTNVLGFTGTWSATEKNNSLISYEWLSLSPAPYIWPNIYDVDGYGPGYDVGGICMVSSQKRIGFGTSQIFSPTNHVTRGTVGSLINKKTSLGGKTKGLSDAGTNVISYDAFFIAPPPS